MIGDPCALVIANPKQSHQCMARWYDPTRRANVHYSITSSGERFEVHVNTREWVVQGKGSQLKLYSTRTPSDDAWKLNFRLNILATIALSQWTWSKGSQPFANQPFLKVPRGHQLSVVFNCQPQQHAPLMHHAP